MSLNDSVLSVDIGYKICFLCEKSIQNDKKTKYLSKESTAFKAKADLWKNLDIDSDDDLYPFTQVSCRLDAHATNDRMLVHENCSISFRTRWNRYEPKVIHTSGEVSFHNIRLL